MVMVIVRFLIGENHRLRDWQAVEVNAPRLEMIPFRARFARMTDPNSNTIRRDIVFQARQEGPADV
jgi:hypothetical protein